MFCLCIKADPKQSLLTTHAPVGRTSRKPEIKREEKKTILALSWFKLQKMQLTPRNGIAIIFRFRRVAVWLTWLRSLATPRPADKGMTVSPH